MKNINTQESNREYSMTIAPDGTLFVWREDWWDVPIADFKTKEEAEEYIRACRKEDQLGREFEAWFEQRI